MTPDPELEDVLRMQEETAEQHLATLAHFWAIEIP